MYDILKTLVAHLLMPLPVSLALLALGLVLVSTRFSKIGISVIATGALVLLLTSLQPVSHRLLLPLESRYEAVLNLAAVPEVDAVVVLGSGWRPDAPWSSVGRLNDSSAMRLMEGIRLWRQDPNLPLIVTGASRLEGVAPVAQGYAAAARDLGVTERSLVVLDWPTDTGQEARAVVDTLGADARVLLVTSASHMPRAMRHFQAAGLQPIAAPTHYLVDAYTQPTWRDWVPAAQHLRKSERAIYEALGMISQRFEILLEPST